MGSRAPIRRHHQAFTGHHGLETNHERTLYVRYVFRNHLISGERIAASAEDTPQSRRSGRHSGSRSNSQGEPLAAAGANGGRITSACAAARFPSSDESWWFTGTAISVPS